MKSSTNEDDPVSGSFLAFLAEDIKKNPSHIRAISSELMKRARNLVSDVDVDLNTSLKN